jgi:Domain of unknown function (DUF5659)
MKYIEEKEYLETSCLTTASCLVYFGAKIEAVDKTNPSKVVFVIRREKGLDQLIEGFHDGSLLVEPSRFFDTIKKLKNRIYQNIEY